MTERGDRTGLGTARIYDVRIVQFVLKIEKLSHIMGPRASQDLRSPSPIMAPVITALLWIVNSGSIGVYSYIHLHEQLRQVCSCFASKVYVLAVDSS